VSGEAVNCDGSAYGTVVVDFFADGAAIYTQCAACHAADGSGGAGPAFSGGALLSTFPAGSCLDQTEWISLGTAGWPDATYGATDKPVGGFGAMPGFAASLTEEQIAEVALYERVQFGGQDLAEAEADCGFGEGGFNPDSGEEATEASG
jgi:mono/diheme cytochrome c family protein